MSEDEYIEAIKNSAERYLEVIRDPGLYQEDGGSRIKHWEHIKCFLSAHTIIRLCEKHLASTNVTDA